MHFGFFNFILLVSAGSINRTGAVPTFLRTPTVIQPHLDMKPFLQFQMETPPHSVGLFHNFNAVRLCFWNISIDSVALLHYFNKNNELYISNFFGKEHISFLWDWSLVLFGHIMPLVFRADKVCMKVHNIIGKVCQLCFWKFEKALQKRY